MSAVAPATTNSSIDPEPNTASPNWVVTVFCTYPAGPATICRAGSSTYFTPVRRDNETIPTIIVTAMVPSSSSVVAALRLLGGRKAGTPLEIASTPVSAAHPEENARSNRKNRANPVRSCSAMIVRSALGARTSWPSTTMRNSPVRISPTMTIMKP